MRTVFTKDYAESEDGKIANDILRRCRKKFLTGIACMRICSDAHRLHKRLRGIRRR